MKILYVLSPIQHPTMRGSLRYYHFMRELSRHNAVTVLALAEQGASHEALTEWNAHASRMIVFPQHAVLPSEGPDSTAALPGRLRRRLRLTSTLRGMKKIFLALVRRERFDVVLLSGKKVYPVIQGFAGLPVVIDFCDATTLRERQGLGYVKGAVRVRQLWRYAMATRTQRKMLAQTRHVAFISDRDRDAVLDAHGETAVIPNGIDLKYWSRNGTSGSPNCIVFTGVMSYPPNEDAALFLLQTVFPRLRMRLPDAELLIVGREPSPTLLEAGHGQNNVTITGFVEDIRPFLERASVFAAPIRFASGLQNKVLEALAMEVPVVTTPVVAAGLRAGGVGEPPLRIAAADEAFAEQLARLLESEQERLRLAREGRRYVQMHFDWDQSAASLEALCWRAIRGAAVARSPGATIPYAR